MMVPVRLTGTVWGTLTSVYVEGCVVRRVGIGLFVFPRVSLFLCVAFLVYWLSPSFNVENMVPVATHRNGLFAR